MAIGDGSLGLKHPGTCAGPIRDTNGAAARFIGRAPSFSTLAAPFHTKPGIKWSDDPIAEDRHEHHQRSGEREQREQRAGRARAVVNLGALGRTFVRAPSDGHVIFALRGHGKVFARSADARKNQFHRRALRK